MIPHLDVPATTVSQHWDGVTFLQRKHWGVTLGYTLRRTHWGVHRGVATDSPKCRFTFRACTHYWNAFLFQICCQVMTNLLAIGAFLYTSEHEDIHIEKPQRKGGSTDPILELSQMSRTRVITLIAICWLLPIVLMWHPMLINCLEDHVCIDCCMCFSWRFKNLTKTVIAVKRSANLYTWTHQNEINQLASANSQDF